MHLPPMVHMNSKSEHKFEHLTPTSEQQTNSSHICVDTVPLTLAAVLPKNNRAKIIISGPTSDSLPGALFGQHLLKVGLPSQLQ